jgi:lysozyme
MIFLYEGAFGEIWIPALPDVPKNGYDTSLFVLDDQGFMTYASDAIPTSRGIDVSSYQGDIDWPKVKNAGIDFAIIRLGYRGYGESGILKIDEKFEQNIKGATNAGVAVGLYFFSQATSIEEAVEEARLVIEQAKGYDISYPVIFDWETISSASARTDYMSVSMLTGCAIAFCETVKEAGYTPMVYFNKRLGLLKYNLSDLKQYDFWFAQYNDVPELYYKFDMWQYSSTGRVEGIEGDVDLNISFADYASRP